MHAAPGSHTANRASTSPHTIFLSTSWPEPRKFCLNLKELIVHYLIIINPSFHLWKKEGGKHGQDESERCEKWKE